MSSTPGERALSLHPLSPHTYYLISATSQILLNPLYSRRMDPETLRGIVKLMRSIGGEPSEIEAKSGRGGYPKSAVGSIVSFANTRGGTILLGIDEENGFAVVGVENPSRYRDAAIGQAADAIDPPVHIDVDFVELDGKQIVVIEVPEAEPHQKPVHLRSKGITGGALIRSGDGDRRMTPAEIGLLYASRTQPNFDRQPVPSATVKDFAQGTVSRTLERVRNGAASLRTVDDAEAMQRVGITVASPEGTVAPTLAGLLAFGEFPQEFFPQLMVSFVVYGEADGAERFLDNLTIRGSIPAMVSETVAAVRRHLATRTIVTSEGREERLDYSLEAVREGVVNALLHRDYSAITQGTQVHVELYPDRLVIRSPGGIYGPISADELGEDVQLSSSRNAVLASLLSDTYIPGTDRLVAENRASGIRTMIREAKKRGQGRPIFTSTATQFTVSMSRSELLGADTRRWLDTIGGPWSSPTHDIALALMKSDHVTNEMLREWGVDRIRAGAVLRELVDAGLAVKQGGRRFARYVLAPVVGRDSPRSAATVGAAGAVGAVPDARAGSSIVEVLQAGQWLSARQIADATGIGRGTVLSRLNTLLDDRVVVAEGAPRSPRRRYGLASAPE